MARAMMKNILMGIVVATMLVELTLAVDHNVAWDTSTNLASWASAETFTVGDNIVFTYTSNHDLLEVSKDDYDSCTRSSAISMDVNSPTTKALTAAGSRYFICGTAGHCDQGMKVEIKTEASSPPTTTTPSSPSPPESTPPSSSSPDTPSPPASTTPATPVPAKPTPTPSPSSAGTVKMTVVSLVGLGFLMMI